ncbi:hypothetical protein JYU34_017660 [Plutella xylostella]|uniref:Uncharacterized protein n=1 Tax=Plutella xylostella TaxID=51655 RepID=A0ABQ7Q1P2_PLUXY|nr:hypothetical protein JYU34_017660 [Plutella xylostella]
MNECRKNDALEYILARKMAYKKITAQENTFVSQMKKRLHRILSTRRGTNTAGFTRLVRGA